MSAVLGENDLRSLIGPTEDAVIRNGDTASAEGIKYDFRQGKMLLKASYGQPIDIMNLPEAERAALRIDPGEVVFIVTEEVLALPKDMMVHLSAKRGLMQSGVLTLGGGVVDPGYRGVLWIGLYNLSSTSVPLRRGRKIIAGVFHRLTDQPSTRADAPLLDDFPDELVQMIQSYRPVELRELKESLDEARRHIRSLQDEITNDKSWRSDFKNSLEEQRKSIDKLLAGLEAEKEARSQGDSATQQRLTDIDRRFLGISWAWQAILVLIGAGASLLIAQFFTPLLHRMLGQ